MCPMLSLNRLEVELKMIYRKEKKKLKIKNNTLLVFIDMFISFFPWQFVNKKYLFCIYYVFKGAKNTKKHVYD